MHITGEQKIIQHITGHQQMSITLGDNASLKALFIIHDADVHIDIVTQGKGSKADVSCIFLSKHSEKVTAKVHGKLQADSSSIQLYLLSFLGEKADCQIDGGIDIAPGIVKVAGHLLEENIVLGKKIKIKTLPMLDVRSSDVNASHGAKIDRLDENKLFYMMAKGLDQKQSQMLIVTGYVQRLCDELSSDGYESEKQKVMSTILDYLEMQQ